jgi:hypothetical protein
MSIPTCLSELIHEALTTASDKSRDAVLIDLMRRYKFWPALQVKKFFSDSDLILLHNTYKREDTSHFQGIYDECRSVVLNLAAPEGENIVVTYAASIPDRMTDTEYDEIKTAEDSVEIGYEGTTVTAYYHGERWFFGTTSCPTIDSSRYFHPTKTHGQMLDEALSKLMNEPVPINKEESRGLRNKFTERLDTAKAYAFLLVHHENKHIMDYSELTGEREYAFLVHLNTRNRVTFESCENDDSILNNAEMVKKTFGTPEQALEVMRAGGDKVYALIVKRHGVDKLLKVSLQTIVEREEKDLGNPNPWHNMLYVYIKNKQDYKIVDYQKEYVPNLEIPKTSRGRELAPTYLVHTIICNLRDILFNAYNMTTTYNVQTKRYAINKEFDAMYAPIIRFHMAQLRHLQATVYSSSTITPHTVYNYLCHRQTIKNLRLLVKHFAVVCNEAIKGHTAVPYGLPLHVAECFIIFDGLLSA